MMSALERRRRDENCELIVHVYELDGAHLNHLKFLSVGCLVSRLYFVSRFFFLLQFEDNSAAACVVLFGKFHEKFSFSLLLGCAASVSILCDDGWGGAM